MGRVEGNIGKKRLTVEELEYRAQAWQSVGWLLLVFDAIVAVFIFVGIRNGSWLWLYWTLMEGVVGIGFVGAGLYTEQLAVDALAHAAAPHLHAAGEIEHREAA